MSAIKILEGGLTHDCIIVFTTRVAIRVSDGTNLSIEFIDSYPK